MKRVAVIGAGITGLCAAYELQRQGFTVSVFEKNDRAGGAIWSKRAGGYTMELGPNTVLAGGKIWDELIDSLGLRERVLAADRGAKKRFIVRDGQLVSLPGNPLTTPILSAGAKWRLLREPFVRRRAADADDETLADFTRRRCGSEFVDYLVNPMVSGIYAGAPEQLSTRHAFPFLWEAEAASGSLFFGAIKKLREQQKHGQRAKKKMISFPNGLQELTDRLALTLGDTLTLGAAVEQTRKVGDEWWLAVSGAAAWQKFDAVISTIPLHGLNVSGNTAVTRAQLDLFATVPYAPVRVLHLGFQRRDVPHPLDGFGFLLPRLEHTELLGVLFSSSLFSGHAPAGKALLTLMLGGMRAPEAAGWPSERALTVAREALRRYLSISAAPEFAHEFTVSAAIPQPTLAHGRVLAELASIETTVSGMYFAGNFRGGVSVLKCVENGVNLARRLMGR